MLLISIFVGVFIWPGLILMSLAQDFSLAGTGETFPFNGVIDINMIGEGYPGVHIGGNGALVCHTDDITCCKGLDNPIGGGRGEWYLPGETTPIPAPGFVRWYRSRDNGILRLNRGLLVATTPTGVYRCNIPTTSGTMDKFIGVYDAYTVSLCPNLNVANGVVTYDKADIPGKIATYSCNHGYTLSGSATRTCTSGGWDGSEPTCVQGVTCPSLTNPVNGQVGVPSRTAGSTATYTCSPGYVIVGVATQTCGSDGIWTLVAPTCAETCSELPALANGVISYSMSSRIVGTTASYSCDSGYTISGTTTRTCMSGGAWSGTAPTCTSVPTRLSIGDTYYPHNSEIMNTAVGRGGPSSPALACFISDSSTAEWYFPNGSVVPLGSSPAGPNVIITVRQSAAITLHRGDNVLSPGGRYCCGSPAIPESQRLCVNLLVVCPSLTLPTNGLTVTYNPPGSPTSQGTIATYQCITGYTPNPSTRTCQSDGTWSGRETTCESSVNCGLPPSIANGSPGTPDRTTFGGTVTYTCETGYEVSPGVTMMTSSCLASGMWSTVTCTAVDCGPPPSVANGSPGTPDRTTFGGTVTYTCEDGLTLSGQAMITCMANGMWSTLPSCPVPPVFLSLSSTNYFTNNPEILISSIGEADTDALVCHTDLTTCCRAVDGETAGEWQFPNGTIIASLFSSTPNDNYFRSRDTQLIRLHRRNNDMAVGRYCCVIPTSRGMETFCANLINSFTPTTSTAPPSSTCPDLTVPANGMIIYSSVVTNARPVGSTATYSCVNGYTINGDTTRTCQSDGTWSGGETTCDPPPAVLSLGSTNYLVNGPNVPLSSVGEGANSLSCHTDDANCCRVEDAGVVKGAWHYPNGSVVSSDSGDLYTTREGPMVVNLNRRDGVDGPTGLYCCVVPTSTGIRAVCAYLGSPLSQPNTTGAIVGGVVVLGLALILSITAIVIAFLVLRQRKPQAVNSKRDQPDILLTDRGQSAPTQMYETVDTTCTYEEIDGTRPLKGNYDCTQNQAYAVNTAPLRRGGVVNTSGSGNPTGDSQVDGDEGKIYEN